MKILPIRSLNLNSQNSNNNVSNVELAQKINGIMTDTVSFGTNTQRFLPQDLVSTANEVLKKYRVLKLPIDNAHDVLSRTKSTEEEKKAAYEIIGKGIKLETPVVISGKNNVCEASLGQYYGGWEFCIDLGKDKDARRYRLELKDKNVSDRSELKMQKKGEGGNFLDFIPLKDPKVYESAVSTVKTMLEALAKV